jgi:hypothetical protein
MTQITYIKMTTAVVEADAIDIAWLHRAQRSVAEHLQNRKRPCRFDTQQETKYNK